MANPREMVQVPKVPVEMYPPQEICPTCGSLLRKGICPISCAPTEDMIGGRQTKVAHCSLCGKPTERDVQGWCTECPKRRQEEAIHADNKNQSGESL